LERKSNKTDKCPIGSDSKPETPSGKNISLKLTFYFLDITPKRDTGEEPN